MIQALLGSSERCTTLTYVVICIFFSEIFDSLDYTSKQICYKKCNSRSGKIFYIRHNAADQPSFACERKFRRPTFHSLTFFFLSFPIFFSMYIAVCSLSPFLIYLGSGQYVLFSKHFLSGISVLSHRNFSYRPSRNPSMSFLAYLLVLPRLPYLHFLRYGSGLAVPRLLQSSVDDGYHFSSGGSSDCLSHLCIEINISNGANYSNATNTESNLKFAKPFFSIVAWDFSASGVDLSQALEQLGERPKPCVNKTETGPNLYANIGRGTCSNKEQTLRNDECLVWKSLLFVQLAHFMCI